MAKCRLCNKRQGKRFCPALRENICSVCCARDRLMEIACPETCTYLAAGRETSSEKSRALLATALSESGRFVNRTLTEGQIHALVTIEAAVVESKRRELKDTKDRDILEAFQNVLKNLQTADSGLIYEHRVASPLVQQLSQQIRDNVQELNEHAPLSRRITTSDEIEAIKILIESAQAFIDRGEDDRAYLRSIAIRVPWNTTASSEPAGLLVTE
jgi:hypothetical protein